MIEWLDWTCTETASRRASGTLRPKGGAAREKEQFTTTTAGLAVLAAWLVDRRVDLVAMEATGVYWKPVYYALESRLTVWLCNARHVKKVPGRKTDLSDAEWLADVAAHGMVRPSFVPPPPSGAAGAHPLPQDPDRRPDSAEIQRLEKVLQDAGIKLTSVASKVFDSIRAPPMIEALSEGEQDPAALAELAKGKMRPKIPRSPRPLTVTWGPTTPSRPSASSATSTSLTRPSAPSPRKSMPGPPPSIPSTRRCCRSRPAAAHDRRDRRRDRSGHDPLPRLTWRPGPASARRLPVGGQACAGVATTAGNQWLRRAMIETARAAVRTKGSYFGAQYRQIARRRGPNKAAVAVAHSLIELVWHLLSTGEVFEELGDDYFQTRQRPERQAQRLVSQLENLGFTVSITAA